MDRKQYYKDYYERNKLKKLNASRLRHELVKQDPEFKKRRQEYFKEYYLKNKEKIIHRTSTNHKNSLKNNIKYKILQRLRTRIYIVLKKNKKAFKLNGVIGCSFDEFKIYLESKFKDGMNWDNYGRYGWHIDHIKPCSKFDLSDPKQQQECFHYTNLQPLWASENLHKHNN